MRIVLIYFTEIILAHKGRFSPFSLLLALLFVLITVTIAWLFSSKKVLRRKLAHFQRLPIASLPEGEKALTTGHVVSMGKMVVSPISGEQGECCVILTEVPYRRNRYELLFEERLSNELLITDGTDYALIRLKNSQINLEQKMVYYTNVYNTCNHNIKKFIESKGHSTKDRFGASIMFRVSEFIIKDGDTLVVAGMVTWENTASLGLTLPVSKVAVFEIIKGEMLYISDEKMSGIN